MITTIDELDKEGLKELRGKLLDMKKTQARMAKEQQRQRADEEIRMLFGRRLEAEQADELEMEF